MTIEDRMENMERELGRVKRRNHWLLGAVLLLVGVLVAAGVFKTTVIPAQAQETRTSQELRTRNLFIEDERGRVRMGLTTAEAGSGLVLFSEDGKLQAMLAATKDGPALQLYDLESKVRTELAMGNKGPILSLWDENGKHRVELGLAEEGPALLLSDENNVIRAGLQAVSKGTRLAMYDNMGRARSAMTVTEGGWPSIALMNEKGNFGFTMGMTKDASGMGVFDEDGTPRATLSLEKAGPNLRLIDKKGKVIWSAIK